MSFQWAVVEYLFHYRLTFSYGLWIVHIKVDTSHIIIHASCVFFFFFAATNGTRQIPSRNYSNCREQDSFQICRKGPGVLAGHQIEHETKMCLYSKDWYHSGLHSEDCWQQVEGDDLCSLLRNGEALSAVSSAGLPSKRETWTSWKESIRLPQIWLRSWSICPIRKGWETLGLLSLQKRRSRGIFLMYINTWRENAKTEPGYFLWCSVTGPEAMDTDWNMWEAIITLGNIFLFLPPWRYSKTSRTWSWAISSSWAERLGKWHPEITSNLNHSLILWFCS